MIRRPTFLPGRPSRRNRTPPRNLRAGFTYVQDGRHDGRTARREPKTSGAGPEPKPFKVGALLAITIFLLFVASFAIIRTRRAQSTREAELPPMAPPRGLFGGDEDAGDAAREDDARHEKLRASVLRARAERGDLGALAEAHATGDKALYRLVLDELVGRAAARPEHVRALAAHVAHGENLRSSPALAELLLGAWRSELTRQTTAELLRVSALSDDAGTFGLAVSEVLQSWEDGRLAGLSAAELRSLFEGEYWLLSSEAKRSGAGFVLKQKLADARRRLAAHAPLANTNTDAGLPLEAPAQKERP
jgi:hypothetical protein